MQTYKEDEWQRVQGKPARPQREAELLAAPVEEVRPPKSRPVETDGYGIQIAGGKKGGGKKKRVATVADPTIQYEEVPYVEEDDEAIPIARPNEKKAKKKEEELDQVYMEK